MNPVKQLTAVVVRKGTRPHKKSQFAKGTRLAAVVVRKGTKRKPKHKRKRSFARRKSSALGLLNEVGVLLDKAIRLPPGAPGVAAAWTEIIWWRTILTLNMLECARDARSRKWAAFFKHHGVASGTYGRKEVNRGNITYVRLSVKKHTKRVYVGSSKFVIAKREGSRIRVLRQRKRCPSLVEPALRWWGKKRNYFRFVPIVFALSDTQLEARILEESTIHALQTSLNDPYVSHDDEVSGHPAMASRLRLQRAKAGLRMSEKFLVRNNSPQALAWVHYQPKSWPRTGSQREFVIRTIVELGAARPNGSGRSSFGLERCLWKYPSETLYLLLRAASCMVQPDQGVAKAKIARILNARGLLIPRSNPKPLVFPMLNHPLFRNTIRAALRNLINSLKDTLPIHHLPKPQLIEGKWPSIKSLLHRPWSIVKLFDPDLPPPCACSQIPVVQTPYTPPPLWYLVGEETHRVIRGTDLVAAHPTLLPKAQAQILRANTGETVLPSTKTLGKICEEQLNDFLEANRFSVGPWGETGWQRFVADTAKELADAAQEVAPPYMFREEDVIAVSKRYRDVLFYCEDKGPTRTVMYCPRHFWALLYKTYLRAPDTFKLERTRVEDAQEAVLKNFPTNIKKLCRWAFANRKNQKMRTLPRGSIIPKGPPKKQYGAARPYVSFAGFFLAKIHRGVGRALAHISLAVAKKHTLEVKNIESACKAMLRFNAKLYLWEQHNADVSFDLQIDNEDLEGFFPSPPHRRLVRDVKRVVAMYKAAFPNVRYILTNVQGVAGRSRAVRERPIPPKFQQGGAQDPVPLDVISSVVQHALEWDLFELGLVVIRQIRGAPIGSNLSPALCMSTVILPEVEFPESELYKALVSSGGSVGRLPLRG